MAAKSQRRLKDNGELRYVLRLREWHLESMQWNSHLSFTLGFKGRPADFRFTWGSWNWGKEYCLLAMGWHALNYGMRLRCKLHTLCAAQVNQKIWRLFEILSFQHLPRLASSCKAWRWRADLSGGQSCIHDRATSELQYGFSSHKPSKYMNLCHRLQFTSFFPNKELSSDFPSKNRSIALVKLLQPIFTDTLLRTLSR